MISKGTNVSVNKSFLAIGNQDDVYTNNSTSSLN